MPRPPPVTSARLPSSRNDGVAARSSALASPGGLLNIASLVGEANAYGGRRGVLCKFLTNPPPQPSPTRGEGAFSFSRGTRTSLRRLRIGHIAAAVAAD